MDAPLSTGAFKPGDQWVAEKRLPLWLIKSYEEGARRAAAAAAAEAARGELPVLASLWCMFQLPVS